MIYIQWYHWIDLGILLMVSELIVATSILIWFGIGAVVVGLTLSTAPGLPFITQLQILTLVSMGLIFLGSKYIKPWQKKRLIARATASVVGECGTLITDLMPGVKGQVKFKKPVMGSDVWECVADEMIKSGTSVRVMSVDGSAVKVKRMKKLFSFSKNLDTK